MGKKYKPIKCIIKTNPTEGVFGFLFCETFNHPPGDKEHVWLCTGNSERFSTREYMNDVLLDTKENREIIQKVLNIQKERKKLKKSMWNLFHSTERLKDRSF